MEADMEKQGFAKRVLYPVAILSAVMSASWIVYNVAWRLDDGTLYRAFATISGTILFLSVTFGTLFIYPTAYFRGASPKERILASLVSPFIWMTKESVRLYISYSLAECLYYYFNPLNIWLLLGVMAQMGLAETFCRWRRAKKGEKVRILSPQALAALFIGLFLVIRLFAWGQGEGAYVVFLSGYRKIFGSGL